MRALVLLLLLPEAVGGLSVTRLRCEYLENPIGLDVPKPRLSWVLESTDNGQRQTAYQIVADGWDSGVVKSSQTAHVVWKGPELKPKQRVTWKVRVWDKDGRVSESDAAYFEMGLAEWKSQWIGGRLVRKKFEATPGPARLYICGLGYYEAYLNGQKVGDHVLDPGFTRYDRRAQYVTHEIQLKESNELRIFLGNGFMNQQSRDAWDFEKAPWRMTPRVRAEIHADRIIGTDGTWESGTSPIVYDNIRNGETYDARIESEWKPAEVVEGPKGKITAQRSPPIRIMQTLKPVKITEPKPGVFVYDLGQNFAGWARIRVNGESGTKIILRYAERLAPDGTLDQKNIAQFVKDGAFQTDTYICRGGLETWEPRFVYHGFQYVEVHGKVEELEGRAIHTSFDRAGTFECSNLLLNKIQRATEWSHKSNFQSIPTDCPHREKNGWTGDAHLAAEQGIYNFDMAAAYAKWMRDLQDEQRPDGNLPGIVPTGGWGYHWGNGPAWDSAYPLICWYLYQYYGDTRVLEEHFDNLKRYVDFVSGRAKDRLPAFGLGDWLQLKQQTPAKLTSSGYFYIDTLLLSKMAKILGRIDEEAQYADLAAEIKAAFLEKYYNKETGLVHRGSQTALSCAIYQGLVEDERTVKHLVDNVKGTDGHLNCGFLGAKYLLHALPPEVAYTVATQKTYPSWGRWMEKGATTLWEDWKGENSLNHIAFGDISAWFYQVLAGIRPGRPGFEHIEIRPNVVGDLTWVKADYESICGKISSHWKIEGGVFTLNVTIPPNTTATVYLPKGRVEQVGSGKHEFTVK